jgi:hypothetical protein
MPTLFSYVVQHDYGLSPNPSGGYCTLAFSKVRRPDGMPNIVELAQVGDWIAGTGGKSRLSAGHGKLVFAMQVTEKVTLLDYFRDVRFRHRAGNVTEWSDETDMYALISDHFFYFGSEAPQLCHPIEKRGPGFRRRFDDRVVEDFINWIEERWTVGIHGLPCVLHADADWVERERVIGSLAGEKLGQQPGSIAKPSRRPSKCALRPSFFDRGSCG